MTLRRRCNIKKQDRNIVLSDLDSSSDSPLPRIAMVSIHGYVAAKPSLGAADTGGQVIYVLELSKKLAQMGYAVDILTRRFEGQKPVERVSDHVQILRIPCGGEEFIPKEYMYEYSGEWVRNALRVIRKKGFSYTFINSHYWDAGVASLALGEELGVPHIHTPHSLGQWKLLRMREEYDQNPRAFEKKYNFTNRIEHEKNICRESLAVTATSSIQEDFLVEEYGLPPEKVKVIPPGYDETRFYPISDAARQIVRRQRGLEGKKVIITLGRLASNKGYDLLIDAFTTVAEREPDAELHMALGGETLNDQEQQLLNALKEQARRLNVNGRVHFKPFIPDEELPDFYRMADVFVLPSRYEPFGMTAVEAMACGTPAVITTRGGLWEELEYGVDSLFANVLDKEDLGITIAKVLEYPELRERLSRNGSNKVRGMFTWSIISQKLISTVRDRLRAEDEEEVVPVPK